jgi:hypothetical protein
MNQEGPSLDSLTRRLAETPAALFLDPRIGSEGRIHTAAVVADLFALHRLELPPGAAEGLDGAAPAADRNRHAVALLFCRLLSDAALIGLASDAAGLWELFDVTARELACSGPAESFVHQTDRREELVRVALASLGLRPAGESTAEALARLVHLHGPERTRTLVEARRAREVRDALARRTAQEAADKWMRE